MSITPAFMRGNRVFYQHTMWQLCSSCLKVGETNLHLQAGKSQFIYIYSIYIWSQLGQEKISDFNAPQGFSSFSLKIKKQEGDLPPSTHPQTQTDLKTLIIIKLIRSSSLHGLGRRLGCDSDSAPLPCQACETVTAVFNRVLYSCSCTLISLEEVHQHTHTHTLSHTNSLLGRGFLRQMVERPSWTESAFV